MRLTSVHPHTDVATIMRKTAFELEVSPDVAKTPAPDAEDIRLLREEIDPLGTRKLETLAGSGAQGSAAPNLAA